MRIKKTLLLFLLSTSVFMSCKDESIKCDGNLEKKTVIGILKDEILKQKSIYRQGMGIQEEYLNNFFNNNLELSLIRTTGKNKELKSCECSAKLGLKLKQEVVDFSLNNIKETGNNLEFAKERIRNILNMKVDIEYTIQETSDDFIVETSVPSDLGKLLGASFLFENNYDKRDNIELKRNEIYRYERKSDYCSFDLWFILSPKNNEVKGELIKKCSEEGEPIIEKFNGIYQNGEITYSLKTKRTTEYYELKFKNSGMIHNLTKEVSNDGIEIKFESTNKAIYNLKE
ncbi:hypothetical protein [Tenacibaculum insulae]|uniref:hypothetical protein n=1 Tax=Tenacibaculum insulae TaxID=2029677 RepID=UPI003AB48F61